MSEDQPRRNPFTVALFAISVGLGALWVIAVIAYTEMSRGYVSDQSGILLAGTVSDVALSGAFLALLAGLVLAGVRWSAPRR